VELGWGRVLAPLAAIGLVLRFRGQRPPVLLWIGLAIVLTYWSLGALAADTADRAPWAVRYMYPGAVGVLLIAAAAASGVRFTRLGLAALFAVATVSLATNLAFLRDAGKLFRNDYSAPARAQLTVIELARDHVDPAFNTEIALPDESPVGTTASVYLDVVDAFGSPAFSVAELERQPESVRQYADRLLAAALPVALEASGSRGPGRGCETLRPAAGGSEIAIDLPRGGAALRAPRGGSAQVSLRRFGELPGVELGAVPRGGSAALRIPPDPAPKQWAASISGAESIELCPPR